MLTDPREVLDHVAGRMRGHVEGGRYEEAEKVRQLALTFLAAGKRAARLRAIGRVPLLVAARPSADPVVGGRGWELLAVRHGRFSGTALVSTHADPVAVARSLAATGLGEAELATPMCQGYHQEAEILLTWLEGDGVRTVLVDGEWHQPARARFDAQHLAERFSRTATVPGA